ncbi:hypothetical protein XENTR_v10001086 [Xenopus tropicalis]|nr:hypothetical protein XENTR_v10001086 [Xenopus tropicalis]
MPVNSILRNYMPQWRLACIFFRIQYEFYISESIPVNRAWDCVKLFCLIFSHFSAFCLNHNCPTDRILLDMGNRLLLISKSGSCKYTFI